MTSEPVLDMFRSKSFQELVTNLHKSTQESTNETPLFKNATQKIKDSLGESFKNFKERITLKELTNPRFDITESGKKMNLSNGANPNEYSIQKDDPGNPGKNNQAALNWFTKILKNVIDKVHENGHIIKVFCEHLSTVMDNLESINNKNDDLKSQLEDMTKKYKDLLEKNDSIENECDEVRQRNMMGNLIVSSPNHDNSPSLFQN